MKKLTYVDSGVLIAASHGAGEVAQRARDILDDPERDFASSEFVKLEVLPKAVYHGNRNEIEFYESFFERVLRWAGPLDRIVASALDEAKGVGLSAMDALHVASAAATGASDLVTTEKAGKPIHRVRSVSVSTIHRQSVG